VSDHLDDWTGIVTKGMQGRHVSFSTEVITGITLGGETTSVVGFGITGIRIANFILDVVDGTPSSSSPVLLLLVSNEADPMSPGCCSMEDILVDNVSGEGGHCSLFWHIYQCPFLHRNPR
jgi:hypothetical protein